MSTDALLDQVTAPAEPGDHDLFAHYIPKAAMEAAILDGIPATALCGKTWLPTRDAQKFPVCPDCKDIFEDDAKILAQP